MMKRSRSHSTTAEVCSADVEPLTILSYSIKKGIPSAFNLYYDLRTIKSGAWKLNNYDTSSGKDPNISAIIFDNDSTTKLYEEIRHDIASTAHVQKVAIACKSGRHRSVAFVEKLGMYFQKTRKCSIIHLDLDSEILGFERTGSYQCCICNKSTSTASDMNIHLKGKKHSKKVAKQYKKRRKERQDK
jgi:hypothetical protein